MKPIKFLSAEENGNHFLCKCIAFTFLGMFIVAFLNWFGIFGTNFRVTQICFGIVSILAVIGLSVALAMRFKSSWMKYFQMSIILLMTVTITSCLTFHATIIFIFPIVYCTVFRNNRFIMFTYAVSAIFMFVALYVGYFFGVCDLNIVFLPTNQIRDTVAANGTVTGSDFILDGTWWKLLLYFGIPRLLILTVFTPICISIMNRIARLSDAAVQYEYMAIHDGMTGLFNKRHYLKQIDEFKKENRIGVIFIDANNLKQVNDTYGHEAGDEFIRSIAKSIQSVSVDTINGYRVGGDEFVIIASNVTLQQLDTISASVDTCLKELHKDSNMPYSIAMGASIGEGMKYDEVVKEAEAIMYRNKEASNHGRNS